MDWTVISAIAEVVAAIAVVVSLIYLAIQVKGNTSQVERAAQANRTQNWQAVVENYNVWRQMVLMPGHDEIWIRGINDLSDLSREERVKFNKMAGSVVWSGWFMYQIQRNEGLMADANANVFRDLYRHPGLREWVDYHRKHQFFDDFGAFLDQVRESVGSDMLKTGEGSSYTEGEY